MTESSNSEGAKCKILVAVRDRFIRKPILHCREQNPTTTVEDVSEVQNITSIQTSTRIPRLVVVGRVGRSCQSGGSSGGLEVRTRGRGGGKKREKRGTKTKEVVSSSSVVVVVYK